MNEDDYYTALYFEPFKRFMVFLSFFLLIFLMTSCCHPTEQLHDTLLELVFKGVTVSW